MAVSRRSFMSGMFAAAGVGSRPAELGGPGRGEWKPEQAEADTGVRAKPYDAAQVDVVVIGSGFGGTMTALTIARAFQKRDKGRVLMLERGTWWITPTETVGDKTGATKTFLETKTKGPIRTWVSGEHLRGLFDLITRCVRRKGQPDGLFDLSVFGAPDDKAEPHLAVISANGVGGGSLVYQNVTIKPPDLVLDELPVKWEATPLGPAQLNPTAKGERDKWFGLARSAIGIGVLNTWDQLDQVQPPAPTVNKGLSNIATRSALLAAHWQANSTKLDPAMDDPPKERRNELWLDRSRAFQEAAAQLTNDYGSVELAINDLVPADVSYRPDLYYPPAAPKPLDANTQVPWNYCERQGRCMIGCLPGARHTLNKQLMQAMYGTPANQLGDVNHKRGTTDPVEYLKLQPYAEVLYVRPVSSNPATDGYEVVFRRTDTGERQVVKAKRVIVAGGTVGTNYLLLRCRETRDNGGFRTLPDLPATIGEGFTNNADYLGFIENTKRTISLFRGPMATSFAHFGSDAASFHTIEDAGLPRIFAVLFGSGSKFLQGLARNGFSQSVIGQVVVGQVFNNDFRATIDRALKAIGGEPVRDDDLRAEELGAKNILGVAGIGRDAGVGKFTLTRQTSWIFWKKTVMQLHRTDGKAFSQDPAITQRIGPTLESFAAKLGGKFRPAFGDGPVVDIGSLHPLGGCRMGAQADGAVVSEFGEVYGYPGLFVADGSILPQALGVNPSLTITAVTLRIGQYISSLPV